MKDEGKFYQFYIDAYLSRMDREDDKARNSGLICCFANSLPEFIKLGFSDNEICGFYIAKYRVKINFLHAFLVDGMTLLGASGSSNDNSLRVSSINDILFYSSKDIEEDETEEN